MSRVRIPPSATKNFKCFIKLFLQKWASKIGWASSLLTQIPMRPPTPTPPHPSPKKKTLSWLHHCLRALVLLRSYLSFMSKELRLDSKLCCVLRSGSSHYGGGTLVNDDTAYLRCYVEVLRKWRRHQPRKIIKSLLDLVMKMVTSLLNRCYVFKSTACTNDAHGKFLWCTHYSGTP